MTLNRSRVKISGYEKSGRIPGSLSSEFSRYVVGTFPCFDALWLFDRVGEGVALLVPPTASDQQSDWNGCH